MKLAVQIAALLCMACVGAAGIEIALLAHQYAKVPLSELVSSANGTLAHLNGSLGQLDASIGVFHDAEQKQADFYDPKKPGGATQQIQRILADTKHLIGTTDLNLNGDSGQGGAIPTLVEVLDKADTFESAATASLGKTTEAANTLLASVAKDSDSLQPILANLRDTSSQTVIIAQNTAKATDEVNMTAHDVRQVADAFRNDYLKPRNRMWFYFKTIVGLGAQAGNIAGLK